MSAESFRVDVDRLMQHADRLGAVFDAIGLAADAGTERRLRGVTRAARMPLATASVESRLDDLFGESWEAGYGG